MVRLMVIAISASVMLLAAVEVAAAAKMRCTDSKTGKYVSESYAKRYPGLTQCSPVMPKEKTRG